MRTWRWPLSIAALTLVQPCIAWSQQATVVAQPENVNVQVNVASPICLDGGQGHIFDIKVMLGLPTAVRVQIPFDHGTDFSYAIEGTIGEFPGYFGSETFYSLGARASYTLGNNFFGGHFLVNPGIDLQYFGGNESALAGTASVEMLWLSEFNSHLGWEVGIDVGIGVGIADFDHHDRAGQVFPVISAFTGLRF